MVPVIPYDRPASEDAARYSGRDVFGCNLITFDRLGASQQAVERSRDPRVIRCEVLTCVLRAVFVGVGRGHLPSADPTLLPLASVLRQNRLSVPKSPCVTVVDVAAGRCCDGVIKRFRKSAASITDAS